MKITVLGLGAMGGLFGAYLSEHNDVTIVDINSELVKKVNSDGLAVCEPDGGVHIYRPKAVVSASGMPKTDLVILFVKSMYSESALLANKDIIGPDTFVMTLQNGSGHEEVLSKFTDESHIVIGTTQHNASVKKPGMTNHGGSGKTYFGCVDGDSQRLRPIADSFNKCKLDAEISDAVQKMIWNKMFTNVSASALTAILQMPLGYISENEYAWSLCRKLIEETVEVAGAMGMKFDRDEKIAEVKSVCNNSPGGLTSIYSDIKCGRKTEVDAISGSVVRAGKKCGVSTPSHDFVVELIHAMESRNI